ncbi:MAG TPA: sugar ABC transporter ATP-binding protein [Stellaceae bacterium]|nr:sugar ABC transporter ATP-binding protein [Stellaceae bacterium]
MTAQEERPAAIEASRIEKSFGGVRALAGASFSAVAGEVHALVGENGAGKSTLIRVIGGRLRPDGGAVRLKGQALDFGRPDAANALGAWTVFQELTLFPWMTVAENLLLGREPRGRLGLIETRRMEERAEEVLAGLGITHIDPRALVEDIALAERQIVEIVRVITRDPSILLLDEPTSSLVEREVEWLFERIGELRARGAAIIFTSHRWNEVKSIADRITVFRNGAEVGTYAELPEDEAVRLMTGQRMETLFPKPPPLPATEKVLELNGLSGPGVDKVSLSLHKGEVLGVGGLAGHGHRQLFFMLFGAEKPGGGTIAVENKIVRIRSPREAVRCGVGLALVPEDRKTEGLLLEMSVRENLTLSVLRRVSRAGIIRPAAESDAAQRMIERLQIRAQGPGSRVGTLSGGNQQKVLLGRWLLADCHIMLLYDVTRGVDVATKHELYELIMRLAREGRSILFYSSDAEELARLSHRVLVMREGRIAAELSGDELSAETIVAAALRDSVAA